MVLHSFFAFIAMVHAVRSVMINCPDLQESCVCPINEMECEFTLRIANHLTLTSYEIGPDGNLLITGAPYTLNSTVGFRPSITGINRPCLFENVNLVNDEDFISRGCSPPITVDGASERSIITVNGRIPGPTLVVDSEAIVRVTVANNLNSDTTSIHWHGMYQSHTPWMDGVGLITQPSIAPGTTFDYVFEASPFGTHWYHSHVGSQRVDGLFGALVVRGDRPIPIPADTGVIIVDRPELYTLTLFDFQLLASQQILAVSNLLGVSPEMPALRILDIGVEPVERGVLPDGSDVGPITFRSGLINGRGRFQNTITPLSEFRVIASLYYRFRVVGVQSDTAFVFSIDGHTLRVIASDGKDVHPIDVDYITVQTGERYDFLLHANQAVGNYWIRAESLQTNVPSGEEYSARGILTYIDADDLDWRNGYSNVPELSRRTSLRCTPASPCRVLNCPFLLYPPSFNRECVSLLELRPRPPKPDAERARYPPSADCGECMYFLNFAFEADNQPNQHSINGTNFEFPPKPYQTNCGQYDRDNSATSNVNTCEKDCPDPPLGGCQCIHVIPLASNSTFVDSKLSGEAESVFFVFSGISALRSHPIHMHGHAYHVVYIGYGTYDSNGMLIEPTSDLDCEPGPAPCSDPRWRDGVVPEGVTNRIINGRVTEDAIQKDTLVIPSGGYVVVAITAGNPGYWFIHCHIEGHTTGGMVAVLQEYSPDQQWLPPAGINEAGNFVWTIAQYRQHIMNGYTCGSRPTEAPLTLDTAPKRYSLIDFGVALAVLIFFAILSVILAILLIVCICIYAGMKKANQSSDRKGPDKMAMTATAFE